MLPNLFGNNLLTWRNFVLLWLFKIEKRGMQTASKSLIIIGGVPPLLRCACCVVMNGLCSAELFCGAL